MLLQHHVRRSKLPSRLRFEVRNLATIIPPILVRQGPIRDGAENPTSNPNSASFIVQDS